MAPSVGVPSPKVGTGAPIRIGRALLGASSIRRRGATSTAAKAVAATISVAVTRLVAVVAARVVAPAP